MSEEELMKTCERLFSIVSDHEIDLDENKLIDMAQNCLLYGSVGLKQSAACAMMYGGERSEEMLQKMIEENRIDQEVLDVLGLLKKGHI